MCWNTSGGCVLNEGTVDNKVKLRPECRGANHALSHGNYPNSVSSSRSCIMGAEAEDFLPVWCFCSTNITYIKFRELGSCRKLVATDYIKYPQFLLYQVCGSLDYSGPFGRFYRAWGRSLKGKAVDKRRKRKIDKESKKKTERKAQ